MCSNVLFSPFLDPSFGLSRMTGIAIWVPPRHLACLSIFAQPTPSRRSPFECRYVASLPLLAALERRFGRPCLKCLRVQQSFHTAALSVFEDLAYLDGIQEPIPRFNAGEKSGRFVNGGSGDKRKADLPPASPRRGSTAPTVFLHSAPRHLHQLSTLQLWTVGNCLFILVRL